jgi:arsenite methyltransferase
MPHHQQTVTHSHQMPKQNKLIQNLLFHLHDTELWGSHLPRIPKILSLLALVGLILIIASLTGLWTDSTFLTISTPTIGFLFILLFIFAGVFAFRKWRYASVIRNEIFDVISLRGDEKVLDVGCGSGLLLNEAAKRLSTGKAIGIDLWAPHSGGGNLKLLWKNAKAEGVADKIEFQEGDARKMSFKDAEFDVVMSSGALHHIVRNLDEHEKTVNEIVRVLKPGGKVVLWDITHMIEATTSKMKSMGIDCEVKSTTNSLGFDIGFDMSMLVGKKK